jgi:NAD(P)-dependent dehydrogenase (short-subunit alcohol dehydrogenase family)
MFGEFTTTDEVLAGVDLTGKRVLVTGVSAGLGVETARALAAHGADVVGRRARPGQGRRRDRARPRGGARAGGGSLELVELDLASLTSVRACADALVADGRPFDLVIANAGVMATPFGTTADGFETQFGTNHLGHFVLINRIAGLLKARRAVGVLASSGHRFSDVDLDDPNFETTEYVPFEAYGRSKTANILFAVEFDRRHKDRGVRAVAVHPGGIQTELAGTWIRRLHPRLIDNENAQAAAAAAVPSSGRPFPRAPPPGLGRGRLHRWMRSAGILRGLPRRRAGRRRRRSAPASGPTPSTPTVPRPCGR